MQSHSADECPLIRLRRRMQNFLLNFGQEESIDRCPLPTSIADCWRRNSYGLVEGPMRLVMGALRHPFPKNRNLPRLHWLGFAVHRLWHQLMRICRLDPLYEFAQFWIPGNDGVRFAGTLP